MLNQILNQAKKKPLLVFGWTLFTLAIGYMAKHEIEYPDSADYFEQINIKINNAKTELDRAGSLFELFKESNRKISSLFEDFRLQEKDKPVDNRYVEDFILLLVDARRELSKILVFTNTTRFYNEKLLNIASALRNDALYIDSNFEHLHQTFMSVLTVGSSTKLKDDIVTHRLSLERKTLEIEANESAIESELEIARQEVNATVRTAQRKADLYKLKSKLFVACSAYIGLFIGGWLGYLWSNMKKQKKVKAKQD